MANASAPENPVDWKKVAMVGVGCAFVGGCAYAAYHYLTDDDESGARKSPTPVARVNPLNKKTSPQLTRDLPASGRARATALKLRGNEHFKAHNYAEAVADYSEAIAHVPTATPDDRNSLATYYQNRAAAHEKLNQLDEVIADTTKAIELKETYAKAYNRRAAALCKLGKYKASVEDLTLLCILERFQCRPVLEEADRVLKLAARVEAADYMEKRGDHAVPLSSTFVDNYFASFINDPVMARANLLPKSLDVSSASTIDAALFALKSKNYNEIADACTRCIDDDRTEEADLLYALLLRATMCMHQGRVERAKQDVTRLLAIIDAMSEQLRAAKETMQLTVNAQIKLGSIWMQCGDREKAFDAFTRAVTTDASNADAYHHRAQLYILLEEVQLANKDFAISEQLAPDFAVARVQGAYMEHRAQCASNEPDTAKFYASIHKLEAVVDEFPSCAEGFSLMGQVYLERGDNASAKRMYEKALQLQPANANLYVHMALAEFSDGEPTPDTIKAAMLLLTKATEVDPHCAMAWETMGTIQVQRGEVALSIEYFDRALNLARTALEIEHVIGMSIASKAQVKAAKTLKVPGFGL